MQTMIELNQSLQAAVLRSAPARIGSVVAVLLMMSSPVLAGTDDERLEADETRISIQLDREDHTSSADLSVGYGMSDGVQIGFGYSYGKNTLTSPAEVYQGTSIDVEWWPFQYGSSFETGIRLSVGNDLDKEVPEGESRSNFRDVGLVTSWGDDVRSVEVEVSHSHSAQDGSSDSEWGGSLTFGIALGTNAEFQLELGDSEDSEPYFNAELEFDLTDQLSFSVGTGYQDETASAGLGLSYWF